MSIVVDASLLAAAFIPSQRRPQAASVLRGEALFAPTILRGEFYNAVFNLEGRRVHDRYVSEETIAEFEALDLALLDYGDWPRRALEVARRHQQGQIFDAIYLACAEDLDAELWTCDARFVRSFRDARPARLKLCPDDLTLP